MCSSSIWQAPGCLRKPVLWWHYADEPSLPSVAVRPETLAAVHRHLGSGGGVLLTLYATAYVVPLGIESTPPDVVGHPGNRG